VLSFLYYRNGGILNGDPRAAEEEQKQKKNRRITILIIKLLSINFLQKRRYPVRTVREISNLRLNTFGASGLSVTSVTSVTSVVDGLDVGFVLFACFVGLAIVTAYAGWRTYDRIWGPHGDPMFRQPCMFCGGPTRDPYHRWRVGSVCDVCDGKRKSRKVTVQMAPSDVRKYRGRFIFPDEHGNP